MLNKFNFQRFLNVARWDLSVNSKFYTRSALLMVAVTCMPVVLYYLYGLLTNSFHISDYDYVEGFSIAIAWVGMAYMVISSGYMFHNLLTKQGRISELTLPATNLERFLWHAVVIVVGVNIIYFVGVAMADLIHALFRLAIPHGEIRSITAAAYSFRYVELMDFDFSRGNAIGLFTFFWLMACCYVRSFCLVNAWKYRYNIPLTFFIYFLLQTLVPLLLLMFGAHFITPERANAFLEWIRGTNPTAWIVGMNIFAALLYIGIWLLTYRLYTRAQLTTKRNP
ncbi:MAG: hypothetical protein IJ219_02355 [Bacteroidaceae bacterium]|nr:hypothetical protein [Bacteroidaceae bacterium]MBQ9171153.1 hypothetical protein [Bacteroidaceae bacterium]MBQ9293755.1 hypothetical protein [Bacteroidaceae bacterium]